MPRILAGFFWGLFLGVFFFFCFEDVTGAFGTLNTFLERHFFICHLSTVVFLSPSPSLPEEGVLSFATERGNLRMSNCRFQI